MNLKKIHLILFLKPYYNWNTFNTNASFSLEALEVQVLNLVIRGIPSIQLLKELNMLNMQNSFKPCYKRNTFNTMITMLET